MVTNHERAKWAQKALDAFAEACRMVGEDTEIVISDLLCDMMHLCNFEQINWNACIDRASGHYKEELEFENDGLEPEEDEEQAEYYVEDDDKKLHGPFDSYYDACQHADAIHGCVVRR